MPDIVVFDLDDTLYAEIDYVRSGIRHVANYIREVRGEDFETVLMRAGERAENWLDLACSLAGWPEATKNSLLWMYRLHEPEIALTSEAAAALRLAGANAEAVVILTDGRSVTQRLKAKALGLTGLEILVSEEWGRSKPDPARFRYVMNAWPGRRYCYIGDNAVKDFVAPRALGWNTVGVRISDQPIHNADPSKLPASHQPDIWVHSLSGALTALGFSGPSLSQD